MNSDEAMQVGDKLRLRLLLPGATELLNSVRRSCLERRHRAESSIRFSDVQPGVALVLRNWLAERLEENMVQQTEEVEISV